MTYYIGLMSGTSMDGVDALLLDCSNLTVQGQYKLPYPKALESELQSLRDVASIGLDALARLHILIGEVFAQAALVLLEQHPQGKNTVAIGSHGQTLLHRPSHTHPYTVQVGCPHVIALRTKRPVIADFRNRDMRLGGQGAPLAPLFHRALFTGKEFDNVAVLNLGGIANLSLFSNTGLVRGFDTGPANVLLDRYCRQHFNCDFDANGNIASRGSLLPRLLSALQAHPFLQEKPPKSADKMAFTYEWLVSMLGGNEKPEDVMHTLAHYTVNTVAEALAGEARLNQLICCGGGAKNGFLMQLFKHRLPGVLVQSADEFGYPVDAIESMMMAWLAHMHVEGRALDYRQVTGAREAYVPGVYYPAG